MKRDIDEAALIAAVHAAVTPVVRAAQAHGPLPALRSAEFLDAGLVVQRAVLLVAGLAWIVGENMVDEVATADYVGGKFHRPFLFPAITEAHRRRWPPTGDRDLWIKYGPDGPPADNTDGEAAA